MTIQSIITRVIAAMLIVIGLTSICQEIGLIPEKRSVSEKVTDDTNVVVDTQFPCLFLLEIPRIALRCSVYNGSDVRILKRGLGVWKGGFAGDSACWIAGHRKLHLFWRLPELKKGDTVVATFTNGKRLVFTVSKVLKIDENDNKMIACLSTTFDLIMFTCLHHPPGTPRPSKRWVVAASKLLSYNK